MRLIDADALIKKLSYLYTKNHIPIDMRAKEILTTIMEQPTAYFVGKVVEELELHSFELGTDSLPAHYVRLNDAIEIVKQGGVSDASDYVCEWRLEDEEANLYLTGCQQRQLIFEGTPKENGYRYCHYCGKKILCKE